MPKLSRRRNSRRPRREPAPRPLDRAHDRVRFHHYSIRTEQAHLGWARRFILFHRNAIRAPWLRRVVELFLSALAITRNYHPLEGLFTGARFLGT
ncbi:MAG: phage integrase N-terminal SAM-like domain-containing protein [Nitrococcus mobilis]|nr:phage integrase N-terminal SAM-like domain-containing protein [Nitrococcus mobilis]